MASAKRGTNDPAPASDATQSDLEVGGAARIDPTEFILDAPEKNGSTATNPETLTPNPETPPNPMPATVDLFPHGNSEPVVGEPLLTLNVDADSQGGTRSRILEALKRWEQSREKGRELTPEELCAGSPELVDSVRDEIRRMKRMSMRITINESELAKAGTPVAASIRHSIPGYEIERELGRGGMGVVYQARQKGLNRPVALKMILSGNHAGVAELDRFRREAESVAALQHPNIVQIFEIGEVDSRPYLAFEYIEGGTLAHHLAGTPWPPRSAAALIEVLARTMEFAHDRGIVHRDLKPGNIMIADSSFRTSDLKDVESFHPSPSGVRSKVTVPKITDFGLAKKVDKESDWSSTGEISPEPIPGRTRTGAVMGTPSYIAPEQAAGKNRDVGPAADVYALGAILYELLTGRPPFRGETALDTVLQVMSEDPVAVRQLAPKVPRDLETICLKCLQKQPAKRYLTAGDLADDLRRFLDHEPIAARPTGSWERFLKWAKRHPAAATWLLTSFLALLTTLGLIFSHNIELRRSAEEKENEAKKAIDAQKAAEVQTRIANTERENAKRRLKEAEEARAKFEHAHNEALRREEEARRSAYALALNRASTLAERDPQRAARLLDSNQNCPDELRDFTWYHLRALCRVEETALVGHLRPISRVAWSPDGSLLATASWDGTVRIWDTHTHADIATLVGHRDHVWSVAFAPDGRTLVTAGIDRQVRFWEIPPGLPRPVNGAAPPTIKPWASVDAGDVRIIAISPDGSRVAAGSENGVIRCWNIPTIPRRGLMAAAGGMLSFVTRKPVGKDPHNGPALPIAPNSIVSAFPDIHGHSGGVRALVWTKSGLYSGGFDKTVRFWKIGNKAVGQTIYTHPDPILTLDVSEDTGLLAVSGQSADDPSIRLWDFRRRVNIGQLRGHTRDVYALDFDADGKLLASAGQDGTVRVWDMLTLRERTIFRGHKEPVRCVAFSPDEKRLASGDQHGRVLIWTQSGRRDENLVIDAPSPYVAAADSTDGRLLAIGDKDGTIRAYKRERGGDYGRSPAHVLKGMNGSIKAMAVSPTGDRVAAAVDQSNQWMVGIWKLPSGKEKSGLEIKVTRGWKSKSPVYGVALHADRLATAGEAGLQLWDLKANELLFELNPLRGTPRCVAFTPDGKYLASAGGQYVQIWETESGVERAIKSFALQSVNFSTVGIGTLREDRGHSNGTLTVIAADQTGTAQVLALERTVSNGATPPSVDRSLRLVERTVLAGHGEPLTSISFSPDGKTIATSSEDRTVRLWDPHIGQERVTLSGHTDSVLLASFLPDRDRPILLSAGREGVLKVWRAPGMRFVSE